MVGCGSVCGRRGRAWRAGRIAASVARGGNGADESNSRGSAGMKEMPVVSAIGLSKTYRRGGEEVRALDGVSFEIGQGEFVAVTGPSGAGKTTLLNIVGCMDAPTSGTLRIGGTEVHQLSERERTRWRGQRIGFVFQNFSLIPTLTVSENVALPALFARRKRDQRVDELLDVVGLGRRRNHRPNELSGGEM